MILYELITRQLPFRGRDTRAVLRAITEQEPEPLAHYKTGVSDGLQRLINRTLDKNVETRYKHVEDLLADLKYEKKILFKPASSIPAQPTMTIAAPPPPKIAKRAEDKTPNLRPPPDEKVSKPRRPIAIVSGVALLLLTLWVLSGLRQQQSSLVVATGISLSITTMPNRATVFLNNDSIGVTPLQFVTELEGTIKLRLQKRDYFALDTAVVITKGRNEKFAFTLKPMARVSLSVNPTDAEVIVDGETIPPSRLSRLELSKGQHTIAISKRGYLPVVEKFDLNHGSNPPRNYTLKQEATTPPQVSPMVFIPAGSFLMGSDDYDVERPEHQVYVDAFYMDKYEVTVAEYQQFLSVTRLANPDKWDEQVQSPNRPVVYVSWNNAAAYAKWKGKRLPAEAEWEYAARGGNTGLGKKPKYRFPWGNEADASKANFDFEQNRGGGWENAKKYLRNVGSYAPNGYGLYDMAGNVWEWCSSLHQTYPYKCDDGRENSTASGKRVLRGGAWSSYQFVVRCAFRFSYAPTNRVYDVGFRCAQDVR